MTECSFAHLVDFDQDAWLSLVVAVIVLFRARVTKLPFQVKLAHLPLTWIHLVRTIVKPAVHSVRLVVVICTRTMVQHYRQTLSQILSKFRLDFRNFSAYIRVNRIYAKKIRNSPAYCQESELWPKYGRREAVANDKTQQ